MNILRKTLGTGNKFLLTAAAINVALLALAMDAKRGLADEYCADVISIPCLTDAAFALAIQNPNDFRLQDVGTDLARAGRFDLAHGIIHSVQSTIEGITDEQEQINALKSIAIHEVAQAAIRDNESVVDLAAIEALAEYPSRSLFGNTISACFLSALEIMGQRPYGTSHDAIVNKAEAHFYARPPFFNATAARMADRIEELIPQTDASRRPSHWQKVADIRVALGDREGATRAMANGLSGNTLPYALIEDWLTVEEPTVVLDLLLSAGLSRSEDLVAIAVAMDRDGTENARIVQLLQEAFAAARNNEGKPWPDYDQIMAVIDTAIALDNQAFALELMQQTEELSSESGLFPWRVLAQLAAAYIDVGVPATARARLADAFAQFPSDESAAFAVGTVAGPISFDSWGISDSARMDIAIQLYRLSDTVAFEAIAEPVLAEQDRKERYWTWYGVFAGLVGQLPEGVDLPALADAEESVGSEFSRLLVARVAGLHILRGNRDAAHVLVRRLVEEAATSPREDDFLALEPALRIALMLGDRDLADANLHALARAALTSRDPETIAEVAAFWVSMMPDTRFDSN